MSNPTEQQEQSWPEKNLETEKRQLKRMAESLGGCIFDLMKALDNVRTLCTTPGRGGHVSVNHVLLAEIGELFAEAMERERGYTERRKRIDPDFAK